MLGGGWILNGKAKRQEKFFQGLCLITTTDGF